jgi:hypothetical protein
MTHSGKARKLANELLQRHSETKSWRKVATDDYQDRINFATLSRFANSRGAWIPQSGYLRELAGAADSCPRCHRKAANPHRPRTRLEGSPCRGCQALKEFRANCRH